MKPDDKVRISVRVPKHLVQEEALDGFKNVSDLVVASLESSKRKKEIKNNLQALDLFTEIGRNRLLDSEGRDEKNLAHGAPIMEEVCGYVWEKRNDSAHERALGAFKKERVRQVTEENHKPEDDAKYNVNGQLARAAAQYALAGSPYEFKKSVRVGSDKIDTVTAFWPWSESSYKPNNAVPSDSVQTWVDKRKRQLEKAGALLLAEWERVDKLIK